MRARWPVGDGDAVPLRLHRVPTGLGERGQKGCDEVWRSRNSTDTWEVRHIYFLDYPVYLSQ
jgi:hypothetical protein